MLNQGTCDRRPPARGPVVGEVLRDQYLGKEPFADVSPLGAGRFAEDAIRLETNRV
jgi:sarcosine oxidase subunit beta